MKLAYETLTLGPMGNNVYFLIDEDTQDCVIIDPGFTELNWISSTKDWNLRQIWITWSFDHTAGVKTISEALSHPFRLPCIPPV